MPHDSIQLRLGQRRELRAFHVHVGAAAMDGRADRCRRIGRHRRQIRAERVRKGDVRDNPAAEERADAPFRPIEKLIGHEDVERPVFLLRLPTALADRMRSTPSSLKPKIFARKFSSEGRIRCPAPCRARNATRLPRKRADDVRTRRIAERSRECTFFAVGQFGHVVQAAAADDANCGMRHCAVEMPRPAASAPRGCPAGDGRIVREEYQRLAASASSSNAFLAASDVHRIQIEAQDPRVRQVRSGRHADRRRKPLASPPDSIQIIW